MIWLLLQLAIGVVFVTVVVVYSTLSHGHNYVHFTNWAFTLFTLYVVLDLLQSPTITAVAGPLAFSVSQTVAIMTAGMYAAGSGLVSEAYRDHNDAVVNLMNLVLHVIPAMVMTYLLVRNRRRFPPLLAVPSYPIASGVSAVLFGVLYFESFTASKQYKIAISNLLIRMTVYPLLFGGASLGAYYLAAPRPKFKA